MWQDLWVALALMLVMEGILPFANPRGFRRAMVTLAQLPDDKLRLAGLVSMVAGLALLWFARAG